MDSILTSIKKLLGFEEGYTQFDSDIIIYINATLMILQQLGVGPITGFSIMDKTKTWTDYLGSREDLEAVKTYVYLKVKLMFDPPSSSFVLESIKTLIAELEWRINTQVETPTDPIITQSVS